MRAMILVKVKRGKAERVATRLEKVPGITSTWPVFGSVDVVARAEVKSREELVQLVKAAGKKWGVASSETLLEWEVVP